MQNHPLMSIRIEAWVILSDSHFGLQRAVAILSGKRDFRLRDASMSPVVSAPFLRVSPSPFLRVCPMLFADYWLLILFTVMIAKDTRLADSQIIKSTMVKRRKLKSRSN